MKNILTALLVAAFLTPAFAAADSGNGINPTLGQLLSRLAAVQALEAGKTISCATAVTKNTVVAGEVFTIGWGSYGATGVSTDPKNMWSGNGEQSIVLETPQVRRYEFSFYGQNGEKTTCYQTITVVKGY